MCYKLLCKRKIDVVDRCPEISQIGLNPIVVPVFANAYQSFTVVKVVLVYTSW